MKTKKAKDISIINWRVIIAFAVFFVVTSVIVYWFFFKGKHQETAAQVSISNVTTSASHDDEVKSNYIAKQNKAYEKAQEQKAAQRGGSHITIGSINKAEDNTQTKPQHFDFTQALRNKVTNEQTAPKQEEAPVAVEKNTLPLAMAKALKDMQEDKNNKGSRFIDNKKSSFQKVASPTYFEDNPVLQNIQKEVDHIIGQINAGTTMYGTIINNLNTDFDNMPVVGKIELGKYRGATLIGKLSSVSKWVDGVAIVFDKMVYQNVTYKVNAIAINADYAPNLYDDIDHHWFQRIGGLIVGAGLGAIKGAADQYAGTNQTVVLTDGGGSAPVGQKPDSKQLAIGAAGGAASDVSSQLKPVFSDLWNRPTTIKVNSGHTIGFLFVQTAVLSDKTALKN